MLLPTTATAVLAALIISVLGWGSWASMYKAAKKARFEFFAYDFAWGSLLASIIIAFTLGSWDSKEITFQDNFWLTGKREMAWGLLAGGIFNVANIMLLAAVAVSGMSVAFPVAFGIAWALGSAWQYFTHPGMNPIMSFGGSLVTLIAVVLGVIAHRWYLQDETNKSIKALRADPRAKTSPPPPGTGGKAFALSAVAGVLFAIFFQVLQWSVGGENGVSSYGVGILVTLAIFASSIVIVPFFLNFPVKGQPLTIARYFKISKSHHLLGVLAGVLWVIALVAGVAAEQAPGAVQPTQALMYTLSRAVPIVAAIWGVLVWRETSQAPMKVHMMTAAMVVLMLAGLGMIGLAPEYGR
jgi:glucose uptake protein